MVNWINVFVRKEYKDVVIESWKYCQAHKGLEIYGWIIMPSHVHMKISSKENKLEGIVRDMKSHTSTALKKKLKTMLEKAGENGFKHFSNCFITD